MSEFALGVTEQSVRVKAARWSLVRVFVSALTLVLVDSGLALVSFVLSYKFKHHTQVFIWPRRSFLPVGVAESFVPYLNILLLSPAVKVWALRRFGLYKLRGEFSFSGDFLRIFKASTLSFLVLVLFAFLFRQGFTIEDGRFQTLDYSFSRLTFFMDWAISMGFFCATRYAVRLIQILYRVNGRNLIPTIVVGCGEMAEVCISEISEKPRLGYKLVGVVKARAHDTQSLKRAGVRVLGNFDNLPDLVRRFNIEEVFITDTRISSKKLFEVLMDCGRKHQIKYRYIPDLFDCLPGKTEVATIGTLPMIKLYEEPLRGPIRALKRGMDVVVAAAIFLVTWPLWLILSILIKLESPGPVFYRQERVGMDGKVFLMIKFRSMKADADDKAHRDVMSKMINGEDANQGTEEKPVYGKVIDDPRLTKIGSWMRRYSVDELPQILNVLKGEMSVVGPRPPIPYEVREYKDWHRTRFSVKPGVTGLWQVSGRNRLHFEEMVRLDIFYIENWSPLLDFKIMLKTVPVVLKGDNAY